MALPACANAAHDTDTLEHAEVFGDRLPGEFGTLGEFCY